MSGGTVPWSVVKDRALKHRAQLAEALVSCTPEALIALQARVQTIDQFIAWFEAGAPQERMIGDENPPPCY